MAIFPSLINSNNHGKLKVLLLLMLLLVVVVLVFLLLVVVVIMVIALALLSSSLLLLVVLVLLVVLRSVCYQHHKYEYGYTVHNIIKEEIISMHVMLSFHMEFIISKTLKIQPYTEKFLKSEFSGNRPVGRSGFDWQ